MGHLKAIVVITALAVLSISAVAQQNMISTYIGGGPNGIPAVAADIYLPQQVVVDGAGNFYYSDFYNYRVFKVSASTGIVTVIAGLGTPGYSGDGGPATNAQLGGPLGVTVDGSGNVYIADYTYSVIREVNTSGVISTVAGTGTCGYDGDTAGPGGNGEPATQHSLCYPFDLASDSGGNVFIADWGNKRIRELSGTSISTVAGNGSGTSCPNGAVATQCGFVSLQAVAVDSFDNLYISDAGDQVIRMVKASDHTINTIAGTSGIAGFSGDGGAATSATLDEPAGLAVNSNGTAIWVADQANVRVRSFTPGGNISTVAGGSVGFCGDGGLATNSCFHFPTAVTVDAAGDLFIVDSDNHRIRKVDTSGNIDTVAGNGGIAEETLLNNVISAGGVTLQFPWGLIGDPSGDLFMADQYNMLVREYVSSSNFVNVLVGNGIYGYSGDGGPATSAELGYAFGVARDGTGNIYIADTCNCNIRKVDAAGNINTVAGIPGSCGYAGDGGPATSAYLYYPEGVYVDAGDNLYVADTYNHVIRKVTGGAITTVAGTPMVGGYSGDGGPATSATLDYPNGVKVDSTGNLYIVDTYNNRVRLVNASSGTITTIAGNGNAGFSGDGVATQNSLYYPSNIWLDSNSNLFIADQSNNRIRMVDEAGQMTTVAGNGDANLTGDGGPAINASLYFPADVYEDASGNLFVTDQYNNRIREVSAFAAVGRSTAIVTFGSSPVGTTSGPKVVKLSGVGPAAISSISASGDFTETNNCVGSLPNGSTCTINVSFTPSATGTRDGTLTINTNGYFHSLVTVALQGQGTAFGPVGGPIRRKLW